MARANIFAYESHYTSFIGIRLISTQWFQQLRSLEPKQCASQQINYSTKINEASTISLTTQRLRPSLQTQSPLLPPRISSSYRKNSSNYLRSLTLRHRSCGFSLSPLQLREFLNSRMQRAATQNLDPPNQKRSKLVLPFCAIALQTFLSHQKATAKLSMNLPIIT